MGEMEIKVGGVEGELKVGTKRIEGLETKVDETRLRNTLANRESTLARNLLHAGLQQRVVKLEKHIVGLDYRLVTTDGQVTWVKQKLQGIWSVLSAPSTAEVYVRAANLQHTWIAARDEYVQRVNNAPSAVYEPRITAATTIRPTANTFIPNQHGGAATQTNPANSY